MRKTKKKLVLVLGIRPDIIRASLFINLMRKRFGKDFILVWSGQHYSENLKDVFFRELGVDTPDIDLAVQGANDAELVGDLIGRRELWKRRNKSRGFIYNRWVWVKSYFR